MLVIAPADVHEDSADLERLHVLSTVTTART